MPERKSLTVALVGNPNTGKSTLFNSLTGLKQRVGNYPGVTVEIKTGSLVTADASIEFLDVPGTYSLSPRSPDELLAVEMLLGKTRGQKPDVAICVVDAANLDRNLFLVTQTLELGIPVVVALNMVDVAQSHGITIDSAALSDRLGVPVVPIQANIRKGTDKLIATICNAVELPKQRVEFPSIIESAVEQVRQSSESHGVVLDPFFARRAVLDAGGQVEKKLSSNGGGSILELLRELRSSIEAELGPLPGIEARVRYQWIAQQLEGVVQRPKDRPTTWTDRIDSILLHRVWGVAFFIAIMGLLFWSVFQLAGLLSDPLESAISSVGEYLGSLLPDGPIRSMIVDGAVAGVGAVLVFLPQIAILFGFLAILEDCGYMARAAFLMDKLLSACGLSGKSFIPMLSSFACAVPGVMATRTIEDPRDRLATILVAPLMSCSARLPVYTLLIGAFFQGPLLQAGVMLSMYLIGMIVAPLVAWLLRKTLLRGEASPFLLELPPYKVPAVGTVIYRMAERSLAFVLRAGTLIFATSIVIWGLTYYPHPKSIEDSFAVERERIAQLKEKGGDDEAIEEAETKLEQEIAGAYQRQSFLGRMGRWIEPAVAPLGWDWKIGMAAIASFPAREVVLAALGTIYSVGSVEDETSERALVTTMKAERHSDGRPVYTVATALSIMVFFALCCQCVSTLAVIQRETKSWSWTLFTFVYMTGLAYLGALIVYQIAIRL